MYDKIQDTVKKPANCAKIVKILTYLSGLLVAGFGVVGLVYMIANNIISSTFFLVFSPIFIIFFGVVIVATELKIKLALESFDFLKTLLGKGLFYIYVSSSVFYFFSCGDYQCDALAWVCSMILFGLGLLFTGLHFATGSFSQGMRGELNEGSDV